MKPTICSRCKKNIAVIFITKVENGVSTNEGLCLKCARELKIKQVDDIVERMGITDEDLDNLNGEMMAMMQPEPDETDEDDIGSRTATFPHMNRLFGNQGEVAPREEPKETQNGKTEKPKVKKHKFLDTYCLSLTGRARAGELDKVVGREVETERVVQILNRRQKNNPCLIGEPGVGKTAIAEGLAQRIVAGDVPFKLRDKEVYLLDLTSLVAGTQFRGQFESRMKSLIAEIKACGNIILVIDEVHNLVGAGDAEGSMNAANILKPALSRGEIQVIGATTFAEYRKYIEKDSALERRFQPVTVNEPSLEEAVAILRGVAHYYEVFHGVTIPPEMARQAVVLSERYITDRFLPDKAIDLLDEACSDLNLHSKEISDLAEKRKERDDYQLEIKMLTEDTEQQDNFERLAKLRSNVCRLDAEIAELEKTLGSEKRIRRLIVQELDAVAAKYGTDRRTVIVEDAAEFDPEPEEETPDYPVTIFVSREGYFKKITPQSLRMSGEQKFKEGDGLRFSCETTNAAELLVFSDRCQVYKARCADFDDGKASLLGDYLPTKLGFDEGESVAAVCLPGDYSGSMLFLFANGKAARVELSAYQTKSNRRKLTGAYSDRSELRGIFLLQEDVQLVLYSTEGRALILQTAQLAPKTTRTTLGVAVLTLRRKAELSRACPLAESGIVNESRYRTRTLPAAGALLREEDAAEKQISLEEL